MVGPVKDSLGLRVKVERIKLRHKQSELAAQAGVSQADVSQLERDKKLVPGRRTPILIALGIIDGADVR